MPSPQRGKQLLGQVFLFLLLMFATLPAAVTVRDEPVTFPTWKIGPPEAMPVW